MEIIAAVSELSIILKLINIAITFIVAWIIHRFAWRLAGLLLRLSGLSSSPTTELQDANTLPQRLAQLKAWIPDEFRTTTQLRQERLQTLQEIVSSAITVLAFSVAVLISLSQFVPQGTVVTMTGLLISALAFAARTDIGDFLAGIGILFQDQFYVGEKIMVKAQVETIEGVVEKVSLNTTWLRARTGELYVIANGEMRFICNYSRGIFSSANVTIKIAASDLDKALPLLKNLAVEAVDLLENLKEPWRVISETGVMAQNVELTLAVRAYFGHAVDLRPQLLALVQERLALAGIPLVD